MKITNKEWGLSAWGKKNIQTRIQNAWVENKLGVKVNDLDKYISQPTKCLNDHKDSDYMSL